MAIDPLMVPYMQKAFGGGQVTEQELQQIMRGPGFSQGVGNAMGSQPMGSAMPQIGNLGAGAAAPIAMPQMMGSSNQPGRGPNPMLMGMLANMGGPSASYDKASGNWTPGPQGFPSGGSGGGGGMQDRAASAMRMMMGGK